MKKLLLSLVLIISLASCSTDSSSSSQQTTHTVKAVKTSGNWVATINNTSFANTDPSTGSVSTTLGRSGDQIYVHAYSFPNTYYTVRLYIDDVLVANDNHPITYIIP
jgi:hypothetical protein